MKRKRIAKLITVVLIILSFVALLAWGFTRDPRAIPSPLVGRRAPAVTLRLIDGGELSLEGLRGQVVVLNFWASWCYPACWNEAPRLEAAWLRYRDRGVMVFGVVYQDSEANARDFIRRFEKTYPNGLDPGSRAAIDFGVYGVPETFFIDRDGVIAHKHIGEIPETVLYDRIEETLRRDALPPVLEDAGEGPRGRAAGDGRHD
ncbi:MAG: TlpA family protein disulfide reductase [Candidatus Methylomirabilia bacterium]